MKAWIKRTALRVAPSATAALLAVRARRKNQAFVRSIGGLEVTRKLVKHLGSEVQSGPFAGLHLGPMARVEHLGPYLLGVYEAELHPLIDRLLRVDYPQVVDVGAKFGYYAAGFGRRLPAARVVAFDTDPWAQRATAETARANGLANVDVCGRCGPDWWARHLSDGALVLSDCEGYEAELFGNPGPLAKATVIIETHDFIVPGTTARLRAAFGPTHTLDSIRSGGQPAPPPNLDLSFLTDAELRLALNEFRSVQQEWLVLTPKKSDPFAS